MPDHPAYCYDREEGTLCCSCPIGEEVTPRFKTGKRKKKRDDIPPEVREAVAARSGGRCEIATVGCWGSAHHMHHRLMRSQGGPHTVDNLLHLCAPCHLAAHHHPDRYDLGWLERKAAA